MSFIGDLNLLEHTDLFTFFIACLHSLFDCPLIYSYIKSLLVYLFNIYVRGPL
jgi:hypothetical protein